MKNNQLYPAMPISCIVAYICIISYSFSPEKFSILDINRFISVDIGNIKTGATTIVKDSNSINLKGYGTMFGMHNNSDEGRFCYTQIKGDFDIIIQVDTVMSSSGQAFAEGGLMVRKDLDPKGLMVANFVTSNNYEGETDQYTFMFRKKEGGSIEPVWNIIENFYGEHTFGTPMFGYSARGWSTNNSPKRNFPYVWLRIIRQGNTYKGYRKYGSREDWGKWEEMSEITIDLGNEPYAGIALSANHHKLNPSGSTGDPASMSEIAVSKINIMQ